MSSQVRIARANLKKLGVGRTGKLVRNKKLRYICSPANGAVAQLVEQWTENPCVGSSILPRTTATALSFLAGLFYSYPLNKGFPPFAVNSALYVSQYKWK